MSDVPVNPGYWTKTGQGARIQRSPGSWSFSQNMTNVPELCAAGDCWDGIVAATIFIAFLLGLYTILWKCMSFQAKRDYAGQQFFFPQSLLPEKKIEDYDRQLQAEHKDHFRFAVGVGESLN
ncbi:uncharacterized protein [Narcine bancroftii]|uniref:uncharacterized protein isoform X3 n=1 Tax=Narcine bancroftii TaxID=1343680 RepID=UPI003831B2C3